MSVQWEIAEFESGKIPPGWEPFHYYTVVNIWNTTKQKWVVCKRSTPAGSNA